MLVVDRLKKLESVLFEHFTEGETTGKQQSGKCMKGSAGKPDCHTDSLGPTNTVEKKPKNKPNNK